MKRIGEDLRTLQLGWPLGMPLVRALGDGLWELRSRMTAGIARFFFISEQGKLVLLHGFVKKSRKLPIEELRLARVRAADVRRGGVH